MSEMHSFLFQSPTVEQVDVYENIMTTIFSEVDVFCSYTVMAAREIFLYGNFVYCH